MPDTFDDLTLLLRIHAEQWLKTDAPESFTDDQFQQQFDKAECLKGLKARVDGMAPSVVAQTLVNHLTRDAKATVHRQLLESGTKTVRRFFRADLAQPALFGVNGLMTKPVIYTLGKDDLVPLKHLDIREAIRHEQQVVKEELRDIVPTSENLELSMRLLDEDPDLNGTFATSGEALYARLLAQQGGKR